MSYITLSADLSAPLDLQPDTTYYLTGLIQLGTYNITSTTTSADHRATIKTAGTGGFRLNGTGTFIVSNIDFTSKNDNSKGAAIAGSTGSPAAGDQTVAYVKIIGTSTTTVTISNFSVTYWTSSSGDISIGWGPISSSIMSLTKGSFKYCICGNALDYAVSIIGRGIQADGGYPIASLSLNNINVDNTCQLNNANRTYAVLVDCKSTIITNCSFNLSGNGAAAILVYGVTNNTYTLIITNCWINGNFADGTIYGAAYFAAGVVVNITVKNSLISNNTKGDGLICYQSTGTLTGSIINSILTNILGAGKKAVNKAGTLTLTHTYNRYYNNTANCFEAIGATEGTGVDPQLGNLPAGCVIDTAKCPFPDGYAIGEETLWKAGSDTFDNLGIDETISTSTGYEYAGTDLITPGIYYTVLSFAGGSDATYSMAQVLALPSDDTDLDTAFSAADYAGVSAQDEVYVDQEAYGTYATFLFKDKCSTNTGSLNIICVAKSSVIITDLNSAYLQIYNRSTSAWDTIDYDDDEPAETPFTLSAILTSGLDNYYDANDWVACRSYQRSPPV